MYFHPSFLRVKMIERLFTQTYVTNGLSNNLITGAKVGNEGLCNIKFWSRHKN